MFFFYWVVRKGFLFRGFRKSLKYKYPVFFKIWWGIKKNKKYLKVRGREVGTIFQEVRLNVENGD